MLLNKKKLLQDMAQDQSGGDSGAKPVDPRIARRRQDLIGRRLRKMYDDVVEEAVPDDFLELLGQADERAEETGEPDQPSAHLNGGHDLGGKVRASQDAPPAPRTVKTQS